MKPKIRLKGFDGEWDKKIMGDLGTTYSGLSGKSKTDFGNGNALYITFLNVLTNAIIDTSSFQNVDVRKGERQNEVKKGDLLFNTSSETPSEVGMCSVMGEEIPNLYLNSFCFGFRLNDRSIDSLFFAYLMRSPIGRRLMTLLAQGATRYNLSKSILYKAELQFPQTISEQQSIANYFKSLDALIQSTTKKVASLKQLKEASLISMFPQGNETTPRVRFKGFEGEWEKKTISKIGFTYSGLVGKSKNDFGTGDAQYITFMNVLCNATIDTSILQKVNVAKSESQNCVMKGDLLFNTSSETPEEVGLCAVMPETIQNVYLNSFCFGLRLKDEEVCPEYFAYLMRSPVGRNLMKTIAQGISRYNLPKSQFCQTKLLFPKYHSEQQQIASYFHNLDNHISLQEQRLEKLKQLKSACLDQMFV